MRLNVSTKINIIIILVVALVLIISGAYEIRQTNIRIENNIKQRLLVISERLAESLVEPLWTLNERAMHRNVSAEMKDELVDTVIVRHIFKDAFILGITRDKNWQLRDANKSEQIHSYVSTKILVARNSEVLGTVEVFLTDRFKNEELTKNLKLIGTRLLILILLIIPTIILLVEYVVSKPVKELTRISKIISSGTLNETIKIKRADEIGELAESFSKMQKDLREMIHQIDFKNKEIKESEEKFRNLADLLPEAVYETNVDGLITYLNRNAYRLFSYTEEDLNRGVYGQDLVVPEEREKASSRIQQHHSGNELGIREYTALKKDGSTFPALFHSSVILAEGEIKGVRGIAIDITERKDAENKIIKSLKEKEVLLKEVHHRVKNNMAVISSLLSLQSGYVDDKKYLDMFKESQSRIKTMALVHEQLYQTEDFAQIDVKAYVDSLVLNVHSSHSMEKQVSILTNVDEIFMDIDNLVPLGLIMNEILTNAFKHSFSGQDDPEISIIMNRSEGGEVILTISDNGVGLPDDFDINQSRGLGLQLINILTDQVKGELEVRSKEGAIFKLTFPEKLEFARHLNKNG